MGPADRWTIKLSQQQLAFAAAEGCKRMAEVIERGWKETNGSEFGAAAYVRHIMGAQGEYAFSLLTGLAWGGKGACFGKDIPDAPFEIRTAPRHSPVKHCRECGHRSGGALNTLLLHDTDKPDLVAWRVIMESDLKTFVVAGYIDVRAVQAQRARFWKEFTGRPAYFVPSAALRSPDTFDFAPVRATQAAKLGTTSSSTLPPKPKAASPEVAKTTIAKIRDSLRR